MHREEVRDQSPEVSSQRMGNQGSLQNGFVVLPLLLLLCEERYEASIFS